jgi:hypothetical protein
VAASSSEPAVFSQFPPGIASSDSSLAAPQFDGWAVVDKKKSKAGKLPGDAAPPAGTAPGAAEEVELFDLKNIVLPPVPPPTAENSRAPTPPPVVVVDSVTAQLTVEAKKIGLLIGPKGVTKIGIQDATGATINITNDRESTAPVVITVEGPKAGVEKAVIALNELLTKGYTTLLTPENFVEGSVTVHPKYYLIVFELTFFLKLFLL